MRNNTSIDDMIANSPLFGDGDTPAELLADAEAEVTALRQRVAELEAQRWVLAGHMKTGMGHGVTLEFTPNGDVIVGMPGANAAVRLPDDVRLCRLASPASDGEGGEQ
jgi:hypothetical protein